jgi:hypothetical protein
MPTGIQRFFRTAAEFTIFCEGRPVSGAALCVILGTSITGGSMLGVQLGKFLTSDMEADIASLASARLA